MKTAILSFSTLVSILIVAACHKSSSTGTGQTCKCQGGFSGQGMTQGMDSLTRANAEASCSSYNAVGPDAFYNCHLE